MHKCLLPELAESELCKGSLKFIKLIGRPLVRPVTMFDNMLMAGGIPAIAKGAMITDGNNGSANKKVARA